jgi:hypothetical protein
MFESWPFEVFAHDLGTLAYFCREIDRPSGRPVLPSMVADGSPALPGSSPSLDAARGIAQETLKLGPFPLDLDALRLRRYAITDLTRALQDGRDRASLIAVGTALYTALGDFALRAAGRWSASGKAPPRALSALDPALAELFETAFDALFSTRETTPVRALVDAVLCPHGGMLREGFRSVAPATWRDNAPTVDRHCEMTPQVADRSMI